MEQYIQQAVQGLKSAAEAEAWFSEILKRVRKGWRVTASWPEHDRFATIMVSGNGKVQVRKGSLVPTGGVKRPWAIYSEVRDGNE